MYLEYKYIVIYTGKVPVEHYNTEELNLKEFYKYNKLLGKYLKQKLITHIWRNYLMHKCNMLHMLVNDRRYVYKLVRAHGVVNVAASLRA